MRTYNTIILLSILSSFIYRGRRTLTAVYGIPTIHRHRTQRIFRFYTNLVRFKPV